MDKQFPPKQQRAAELFSNGIPVKQVSEVVGVSLSQLYKWKNTPAFNDYVNELLHNKEVTAYQDLFLLKSEAVETLKSMLNCKDTRTKLKAIELLMKFGT